METKITAALLLRVYQRAIDNGERVEGGYRFCNLMVTLECDGYSVAVSDGSVTASVLFHNKVSVVGETRRSLTLFRKRVDDALAVTVEPPNKNTAGVSIYWPSLSTR